MPGALIGQLGPTRRYASFLLRCWYLGRKEQWLTIEHTQSEQLHAQAPRRRRWPVIRPNRDSLEKVEVEEGNIWC